MNTYEFASLRGNNFIIDGYTPNDAWNRLVERERDNGSLWKTSDKYCNQAHVNNFGFSFLDNNPDFPAYKQLNQIIKIAEIKHDVDCLTQAEVVNITVQIPIVALENTNSTKHVAEEFEKFIEKFNKTKKQIKFQSKTIKQQ